MKIPLYCTDNKYLEATNALSNRMDIPVILSEQDVYIYYNEDGLNFKSRVKNKEFNLNLNFTRGRLGFRNRQSAKEPLLKALGDIDASTVVADLTMGFAEDSLVLAKKVTNLICIEENKIVFSLVQDACIRAGIELNMVFENSLDWLASLTNKVDISYLDPMFHQEKIKSKVKKEMQALQLVNDKQICKPEDLLLAALEKTKNRVIVKRAKSAGHLLKQPSYSLSTKTIRFDIYRL